MWKIWKIETDNKETRYVFEKKRDYNEAVYRLFIDLKVACDSVRGEILYNILIFFGIHMRLVGLIKMCLTETHSKFRVGKNLSDMFPIKMV